MEVDDEGIEEERDEATEETDEEADDDKDEEEVELDVSFFSGSKSSLSAEARGGRGITPSLK